MNNIKAVRLENFQSHLDTYLDFHDGLNVLVGQSDSGKTAILRGIRWVLFNQPRGTDFVRVGADFARVSLWFENGQMIVRERTPSKNRYIIRKPDNEELILEGFGIHVPEEVIEVHGINSLRIDRDHELFLHISQQLDGPFLLEQTGSLRAKTIGRISGAHYLDMAIRDASKDISQVNQRIRQNEIEVAELKEQLQPYDFLQTAKRNLDNVQEKLVQVTASKEYCQKLTQLKTKLRLLETEIEQTTQTLQQVQSLDKWEMNLERLELISTRLLSLNQKKAYVTELETSINVCQLWLEKTKHVPIADEKEKALQLSFKKWRTFSTFNDNWNAVIQLDRKVTKIIEMTEFIKSESIDKLEQVTRNEQKKRRLTELSNQLNVVMKEKMQYEKKRNLVIDIDNVNEMQTSIPAKLDRYKQYERMMRDLSEIERRLTEGAKFLQAQQSEQEKLEHDYEHLLAKEGTCPTCGSEFDIAKVQSLFN